LRKDRRREAAPGEAGRQSDGRTDGRTDGRSNLLDTQRRAAPCRAAGRRVEALRYITGDAQTDDRPGTTRNPFPSNSHA